MHRAFRCSLPVVALMISITTLAGRCSAQTALTDFAVFGKTGVALGSSAAIDKGFVGSNLDVSVSPFSHFAGLTGGGMLRFDSTGGGVTIDGPITFNGDAEIGQDDKITGLVNIGGSAMFNDRAKVTGDITVGSDLFIKLSAETHGSILVGRNCEIDGFSQINGNLLANGDVLVKGTVNGDVTCHDLQVDTFGQINGNAKKGAGTVAPAKYAAIVVPPADTFTAGRQDILSGGSADYPLHPGKYGSLTIESFGKLYLTSGDYYFTSLTLDSSSSIHLVNVSDTKGLHVFVTGDLKEGTFVAMFVNGAKYSDSDSTLASKVLWEVLGTFNQTESGQGSDEMFGTIFVPTGPINLGNFVKITGSLISGGKISAGNGFTQIFVPSGKFAVPPLPVTPPGTPPAPGATPAPTTPVPAATPAPPTKSVPPTQPAPAKTAAH